jgi:hypothetical protein
MVWAVFYHHFGCHDTCGEWCPWLRNKDNPVELAKLFYRDKIKDKVLYEQILEIWVTYCLDEALRDNHHEWQTNKCESMNKFIYQVYTEDNAPLHEHHRTGAYTPGGRTG